MRKFKLVIEAIDNECDVDEDEPPYSLEEIKKVYQDDILNDNGYMISIKILSVEELQLSEEETEKFNTGEL